ncbi:MAG: hypothetical protein IPJ30_21380 [Acidobacteria bacterium]|nr:hypothetical protein [Acidobacteriota bacterium]
MLRFFESDNERGCAIELVCAGILLFSAFMIVSPATFLGIPNAYDLHQHLQFAATYFESMKAGNILPGWSAFENHGYGGIGIRIYPPFAHYTLALTHFATGDWYTTVWTNLLFWTFVGGIGIYRFAREWLLPFRSLIVGLIYIAAPFRLGQIYQSFFYSEYIAGAILPFCFLYLTRVVRGKRLGDSLLLGFLLSVLILTHIPMSLIGLVSMGIYAAILIDWHNISKVLPKLLISGISALAATAFYWIRLVTESGLVNHSDPKYTLGDYDYRLYFFPQIYNTMNAYFIKQMWIKDVTTLITFVLVVPFAFYVLRLALRRARDVDLRGFLAVLASTLFAMFMASIMSAGIWGRIALIQKLQFPFRWLTIVAIFGSLAVVIVVDQLEFRSKIASRFAAYALILVAFGVFLFELTQIVLPSEALDRRVFAEKIVDLNDRESYDCWWPIWSRADAFKNHERVNAGGRAYEVKTWSAERREFVIDAGPATKVRVATFFYPFWSVRVNGDPIDAEPAVDGALQFDVPETAVAILIEFREPRLIGAARMVSAMAWLGFAGTLVFLTAGRRRGMRTLKYQKTQERRESAEN